MMGICTWLLGVLLMYHMVCRGSLQDDEVSTPSHHSILPDKEVIGKDHHKKSPEELPSSTGGTDEGGVYYTEVYTSGTSTLAGSQDYLSVVSDRLFLVCIPILTLVGIVGNLLTIATTQRKRLRLSPIYVYMTALACADTLVLVLDFLNNWVVIVSGVHLVSSSLEFCQTYNFLFTSLYTYAAWLVTCIACERCIVVWWPLKAKRLSTLRKSRVIVCVSLVLCGVIHSYNFLIWDMRAGHCDMSLEHAYFFLNVYPWLSAVAYSYLPVTMIVVCNILILVGLKKAAKRRKMLSTQENRDTRSLTITMVAICVTFVVNTIPLTIFFAVLVGAGQYVQRTPAMSLGRNIILILGLTNHSINFFLYVMTSSKFREELRGLCGLKESGRSDDYQLRDGTEERGSPQSVATVGTSLSKSEL